MISKPETTSGFNVEASTSCLKQIAGLRFANNFNSFLNFNVPDFKFSSLSKIFKKVADLIAGPYRYKINAAAMLDIGKSVFQAEVDASCELIDF